MICHSYNFLITKTFTEGNLENPDKQQEESKNHKGFHLPEIIIVDIQVYFHFSFFSYVYFFKQKILGFFVF